MNEWAARRLDELGQIERGRSRHRPRNDPRLYGSGVPFFQTGDVKAAVLHLSTPQQWYSERGVAQSRIWGPGVTCITIAANIAETAVLGVRACFPDSILGFTPSVQSADAYFVKYLLDAHRSRLTDAARGTTQDNLSVEKLLSFKFPMPEARERSAIASVLRTFDELIENNHQRVRVLEEMARAIYREWFVRFRYPGHESAPLVDSSLGPIPEGWRAGVLDDLVRLVKDTVDPSRVDRDIPAVGLEHIPRQQITLDAWGVAGDLGSRKGVFARGDVLFGKIRPYFHKVSVAPFDGICSTDGIILRPEEIHWAQAVFVLSSAELVAHATTTSNGTKMPRADWRVLGKWPIVIPPAEVADAFTGIARRQLSLAETLTFENARLAALRDLLLPKLVTGQIDVSGLDLDAMLEEPAA